MKKPSLLMVIADNGMGLSRTSWAFSLAVATHSVLRDYEVTFQSISYPYPDGTLNIATQVFLESSADEMIIIDTDVIFTPDHLRRLLSHDLPLVFGLYPKKCPGLIFPVMSLGEEHPFTKDGPDLVEVARVARGFMRVHRSVFEQLKPHVEKITCAETGREQWVFWKTLPGGNSEDFAFCDLCRAHGIKIMVDQRITAQHEGSARYPIEGTY